MKAILTVVGKDKVGIIAGVSQKLAELNINILWRCHRWIKSCCVFSLWRCMLTRLIQCVSLRMFYVRC